MSKLRILIADDHAVVRAGVRSLLEQQPDWEVCAEAANGREAVTLAQELNPDIAVLDITMPQLNGLDAARQILKDNPSVLVLILSVHESEQLVREIIDAGAHGYLLKSDAGPELATAVQALSRHELYFTAKYSQIAMELRGQLHSVPLLPGEKLTPREREVLQLLAEGKSNKGVGEALGICDKTVETHRANVMSKLGLHSVAELVHYAIQNKIVAP